MNSQPLHVLLIEDSPTATELVQVLLTSRTDSPFALTCAGRLDTGLHFLSAGGIDAVLLDLFLPDSQGLDTVRRVREQTPRVPIIVFTGFDDEALGLQAVKDGAQDFLVKSQVDGGTLERSLLYACERVRRQQAEEALRTTRVEFQAAQARVRQQDRELTAANALLKSIFDSSTEYAILACDLDGTILTWNEGARRTFGYTAVEMAGRENLSRLCSAEDLASGKMQALLEAARETGQAEGELECLRQDGRHFTASAVVTLRRDADGAPAGFTCISRDVTEQKSLEKQLRRKNDELQGQNRRVQEASRLKSEFLANMSHELRTPLNGIIGFAELMHDGRVGPVSAEHKEYLGDILTSAHHLLQLINDILDLSKVEAGKMEFRAEPVDVAKLAAEIRDIVRTLAAAKRIKVGVEIDPALGQVVTDPARLKQVFYNYLSNALKFTPEEGRVTVRAMPEGADAFRLEVEDTGIGIPPAEVGRLFVEFQQLDASAAKRYPGTGLGLALTKRIVEAQGGKVGVRSAPGAGSVFFAVLPRIGQAASARPAPPQPACPEPAGPAVLVIEDSPEERDWLAAVLRQAGYTVETAASGAEAVARCRQRAFSAITLDLLLPDMSSRDVLRAIREGGPNANVPILVLTVVAERGSVAGFKIHDFLVKPIQIPELLASLQRAGVPPDGAKKVLVVDDEPAILSMMEALRRRMGYQPICVADGASGLRAAEDEAPAAVVLDLLMPGMDGFTFLERFRQTAAGRHIPVIVWTGKELTDEDRDRLRVMAQGVVLKSEGGAALLLDQLRQQLQLSPASS